MQVIKPFDINDSNMTSTIAEPDLAQGEVEWDSARDNFFSSPNQVIDLVAIGDFIYSLELNGGLMRVAKLSSDGTLVSSFSVSDLNADSITTDGSTLFVSASASTTTSNIYKYDLAGSQIGTFLVTLTQATNAIGRSICYKDGLLYMHGSLGVTHSTVSTFSTSVGTYIGEHQVAGGYSSIAGITVIDGIFYVNSLTSIVSFSDDWSEITRSFDYSINGNSGVGLGSAGGVFFSGAFGSNQIGKIGPNGESNGFYFTGEQAIKVSTHKIYQAATNTTDDPEVGVNLKPPSWEIVSATNKYRAFDYVKSVQATSTSPLVYTFTPNQLHSAIAAFNIDGVASINITVTDPVDGEVYNEDITMIDYSGVINAWQYYFYQLSYIDRFVIDDLPPYKNATITVTLTSVTDINVGEIALGRGRRIGVLVKGTSTDRKSYSTIETDSFGNETVTKRPSATHTNFAVSLPTNTSAYVERTLKDSLDVPTLFIGKDVDGARLIDLGYYERSPLVRANQSLSQINLKVRGLV